MNSLVDETIIDALYRAGRAGVPIDISVRGICSLVPGLKDLSESIRVRSVLGRYLEHSRIYSFHNSGKPTVYIGSSDMMHRNLDRRIEVLIKLENPEHIERIQHLFELHMNDSSSTWSLAANGEWTRHTGMAGELLDIQEALMAEYTTRDTRGKNK
jgi:polyphosphate kinase